MTTAYESAFEYGGESYTLTIRPTDKPRSVRCFIKNGAGEENGWMDYVVSSALAEIWTMSEEQTRRFLERFALFHARTLIAKGGAIGNDEYHFDADFGSSQPESLIEKIESRWAAMV
jgi:hypothetical protein